MIIDNLTMYEDVFDLVQSGEISKKQFLEWVEGVKGDAICAYGGENSIWIIDTEE